MVGRRLIEEALPLKAVNAESAREKSLRHGHISTMHLWWARRPLAMSRAVVYGTLLPDPGDPAERAEILKELAEAASFEAASRPERINPLRRRLAAAWPDGPPKVLDCFAGGGAIPLEALRLGCDVTALDLNPVAYLIEKCVLEYPQRFGQPGPIGQNPLADDFVRWATWVRKQVEPKLAKVFPAGWDGRRPAVYFWVRTMACPNPTCRVEVPLLSSFWLANSGRRTVWVEPKREADCIRLSVHDGSPPVGFDASVGTVKASSVTLSGLRYDHPGQGRPGIRQAGRLRSALVRGARRGRAAPTLPGADRGGGRRGGEARCQAVGRVARGTRRCAGGTRRSVRP